MSATFTPIEDPVPSRARQILEWLYVKSQADELVKRANQLRDRVNVLVDAEGYEDNKGNIFLDLDNALTVGEKTYASVKRELKVKRTANEDRIRELAERIGAVDRLFPLRPVVDVDELYVLYQEGRISETEIDEVFDINRSYALKAVAA